MRRALEATSGSDGSPRWRARRAVPAKVALVHPRRSVRVRDSALAAHLNSNNRNR